jgi:hypothetical protein
MVTSAASEEGEVRWEEHMGAANSCERLKAQDVRDSRLYNAEYMSFGE